MLSSALLFVLHDRPIFSSFSCFFNNIWWSVKCMKFLVLQLLLASYYFCPLSSEYFSYHPHNPTSVTVVVFWFTVPCVLEADWNTLIRNCYIHRRQQIFLKYWKKIQPEYVYDCNTGNHNRNFHHLKTTAQLHLNSSLVSNSGIVSREHGRRNPSHWPRGTFRPQKLAQISPTCGGRSVGIVRSWTQATDFGLVLVSNFWPVVWREKLS
jgi:hypothetical protein